MRVLVITKIFPNGLEPLSSPFNRQQFGELAKLCDLSVLEAIPYVPGARLAGNVAGKVRPDWEPPRVVKLTRLPATELLGGIETFYMRQLYVPKVGLPIAVPLYLASLAPYRRLARGFDKILATWAYPDGCASVLFARALGKPCVVKVHGSDINVVAKTRAARPILRRVLPLADAVVTVSRPLGEELADLGVPRSRIHLVPNGVDTTLFAPRDRAEARRALGLPLERPLILFVGRLEPQKGIGELLPAFATVRVKVPGAMLALVGTGVSKNAVAEKVREWGGDLVAPGARPLGEVATWMAACNVFTLPSWNEGTPNVVLEALASGRPAVGSAVGGIPDVLSDPRSGIVVPAKNASALADALIDALAREWPADEVRACGPGSWSESAVRLYDVLKSV